MRICRPLAVALFGACKTPPEGGALKVLFSFALYHFLQVFHALLRPVLFSLQGLVPHAKQYVNELIPILCFPSISSPSKVYLYFVVREFLVSQLSFQSVLKDFRQAEVISLCLDCKPFRDRKCFLNSFGTSAVSGNVNRNI